MNATWSAFTLISVPSAVVHLIQLAIASFHGLVATGSRYERTQISENRLGAVL
jgi:hypothetical protein